MIVVVFITSVEIGVSGKEKKEKGDKREWTCTVD